MVLNGYTNLRNNYDEISNPEKEVLTIFLPLEQRKVMFVKMEVMKSVKQETRHFSDERFKIVKGIKCQKIEGEDL